jgi:transcriptional regulator of acetoin/glycerol metabolism
VAAQGRARSWLLVTGEPGVGKCAVIEAAHRQWRPTGRLVIVDAAAVEAADCLEQVRCHFLEPADTVVLRHADRLTPGAQQAMADLLNELVRTVSPAPWFVATSTNVNLDSLLEEVPVSVAIPPLRHHTEDIRDLVPAFIERYAPHAPPTCTPGALQTLLYASWPGNTAQLERVLRLILSRRRVGQIGRDDLPPECHVTTGRILTPLEALERDAIVHGLMENGGNKSEAASQLGISRATIYRKIQSYGIVIEPPLATR